MKKLINIILATFAILVMTTSVAKADSSITATIFRISKVTSDNSSFPTYEGFISLTSVGVVYWGDEALGYCNGFPEPTATDLTLLGQAKQDGASVTLFYQTQNSVKCYTGFQIN